MHKNQQPQTETFELSVAEREVIEHEMCHYEDPRAASIEALKIIQKQRDWVPNGAIHAIADVLDVPTSGVGGVATSYGQIFRQSIGRRVTCYCDSVVCHIGGYQGVQAAPRKKLNIKPGQTTFDDRFTLLSTCYLGNCDKGPSTMIDEDTHAHLTPGAIPELLERYK